MAILTKQTDMKLVLPEDTTNYLLQSDKVGSSTDQGDGKVWQNQAGGMFGVGTRNQAELQTGYMATGVSMFAPDTLRASVEAATGGRATVLYDDLGYPSYMVVIPAFNLEDVFGTSDVGAGVHPAFLVNGVAKSEIFISMYQNFVYNNRAISIPGVIPATSITFDTSKTRCTSKGAGWHLMTNWEWAAIALWCVKNGFQPKGNTNFARSHDNTILTGTRENNTAPGNTTGNGRTKTGSGPVDWRHDASPAGIADMVGNVWEWVDGFKLVDGRIYMPADNDFTLAEGSWPATDVYMANQSGILRLSNAATAVDASINVEWKSAAYDAGYDALPVASRQAMTQAMIASKLTSAGSYPAGAAADGRWYANTSGERFPLRGGYWSNGSNAGLGALLLGTARSNSNTNIGFRSAFVAP